MLQGCCCVQLMQVQKMIAARQLFSHFHFISSPLQMTLFSAQDVQITYGGEGSRCTELVCFSNKGNKGVQCSVKSGSERGYSLF